MLFRSRLELSRLQNTNFKIEKSELNLADILKEAVRSMQRIAEQKQVTILLENEAGNVCFFGDYGRLRQMFMIILDNAVKFAPADSAVSVKMYYEEKGFREEKESRGKKEDSEKEKLVISISDRGSGILPEELPYIFDHFHKERSEQNKSGSGLGLPIAKQIAERHQIAIKCESNARDRTSFSFIFSPEMP